MEDLCELERMVKDMRLKEDINNGDNIVKQIIDKNTLTEKCILARMYLQPQSTLMERIIKTDLKISNPIDNISGDGCKNNINYEIKVSIHSKDSKLNIVQICPDHNIDYYIVIYYNLHNDNIGDSFILKVPCDELYNLVIKYGSYAHGTINKLGKITLKNIKGNNNEYSLRCAPNIKGKKNLKLYNELIKHQVEYKEENF